MVTGQGERVLWWIKLSSTTVADVYIKFIRSIGCDIFKKYPSLLAVNLDEFHIWRLSVLEKVGKRKKKLREEKKIKEKKFKNNLLPREPFCVI